MRDDRDLWHSLRGVTVLVMERDAELRGLYATALELSGAIVMSAESVAYAVALLAAVAPDAVVTDVRPADHGRVLLAMIRAVEWPQGDMPVIAVSAYFDAEPRLTRGFDAALTKPVDPDTLCDTVARLVNHRVSGPRRGDHRVLLVEADRDVGVVYHEALERHGYLVRMAPPPDALGLVQDGACVDVVVTSAGVPPAEATALSAMVASRRPGVRCVDVNVNAADPLAPAVLVARVSAACRR